MDQNALRKLLERVRAGEESVEDASERIARFGVADLGFARIDHHRLLRRGVPEVIFGEGKSDAQIQEIVAHFVSRDESVLVTRVNPTLGERLAADHVGGVFSERARLFHWAGGDTAERRRLDGLLVVSAGTGDLPVAEEAAGTAEAFGIATECIFDVGVAGLHRLVSQLDRLREAKVIIVAAGMEGALPSVVTGLVACPVIGVPTSVGYGVSADGTVALRAMLASCAGGLVVVNVDNGFGAACAAHAILRTGTSANEGDRPPTSQDRF